MHKQRVHIHLNIILFKKPKCGHLAPEPLTSGTCKRQKHSKKKPKKPAKTPGAPRPQHRVEPRAQNNLKTPRHPLTTSPGELSDPPGTIPGGPQGALCAAGARGRHRQGDDKGGLGPAHGGVRQGIVPKRRCSSWMWVTHGVGGSGMHYWGGRVPRAPSSRWPRLSMLAALQLGARASICSLGRLLGLASPQSDAATSPTLPSAPARQSFVLPRNILLIKTTSSGAR